MINRSIKQYEVEALLGKGGMGAVYLAQDTKLERKVALKVLPPELMRDPDRRSRFVREARAASAVNHPAIAQIYEIDDTGDIPFIAMEYVDGSTVRNLVERGELDIGSAVDIGIRVGQALSRAHEVGIVHRDIKSDNIMVTKDGHPKVLDFGLAKLLDVTGFSDADVTIEAVAMTQAGVVLGTAAYMSPEQARGQSADNRSDVFSFGIVLYEMATGKLPFQGESMLDTMHAIAYGDTQPIRTIRNDLPYSLQKVIDRCLEKKPEERYQELEEAVVALTEVKREIDSGVSGGVPILERLKFLPRGFSTKGTLVVGIWSILLLVLSITVIVEEGGILGVFPFLIIGIMVYAHVRGRRGRLEKSFAKKVKKLPGVRLVAVDRGDFVVVAENPTAATYVKLNDILERTNNNLYYGLPFKMTVREDATDEDVKTLARTASVKFLRKED